MNNEWHPFPDDDDRDDSSRASASRDDRVIPPPPAASASGDGYEETRPLYSPSTAPAATPMEPSAPGPRRRTGALSAAVLVGALVVGGVAGVGGAAGYSALHDGSSGTNGSDFSSSSKDDNASSASNTTATGVEAVAQKLLPSVVQINVSGGSETGTGSGIVLSKDGVILTNNHVVSVVKNGGSMSVTFQDGSNKKATVVGTDPVTDLAVIKTDGVTDATPAELGKSSSLKVGQPVVAVGSPFGLGATVTSGIVSALDRAVSVSSDESQGQDPFGQGQQSQGQQSQATTYPAIQIDASINPGNSGGPLVNMSGQVVGINSAIRTGDSSGDSGGSVGIGFAIPIDEALPIINQLKDGQTATHARLGVTVSDNASSSGAVSTGAVVKSVEQGGSADRAGLKVGDVITKVGSKTISGSDDLVATIRGQRPGEKVELTYLRGGDTKTTEATLGSDENTSSS